MERDAIDYGSPHVAALFRKLFVPTLLGMLSISVVTMVDGVFVGHGVGSDGIAAVNICIPLWMIFSGLGLMVGAGCSVVASVHLAQGKLKAARLNVTQALAFVTLVVAVPVVAIMLDPARAARLLGASEHLLPLVIDYLCWFVPATFFQMWIAVALFILRLDGAPRLAMWCSVLSAGLNVVLDWWFIFPLQWGVMGAALASSISVTVGGVIVIVYLGRYARGLRLLSPKFSRKSLRLSLRNIGYQCRIGFSSLMGEATLAVLMFTGNQLFMRYLGDDGVGAFGIACYYTPFVFMVGNAVAQSAQPILSYNLGAGRRMLVSRTARIALLTAAGCGVVIAAAFVFTPQLLVGLFLRPDNAAAQIAIHGFPLYASGFVCFLLNLAAIGYYQSTERVLPAMLFASLRGCVFLVPCFLLLPLCWAKEGIWLAMPLSELMTTLAITLFFAREFRRDSRRRATASRA